MAGNGQAPRVWKGEFIVETSIKSRIDILRLPQILCDFRFIPQHIQLKLSKRRIRLVKQSIFKNLDNYNYFLDKARKC